MEAMMPEVQVEFYGVPRLKAGVAALQVEANSVAELFAALQQLLPQFAAACFADEELAPEYLLCLNGKQFTRDSLIELKAGDAVLILSADVGG